MSLLTNMATTIARLSVNKPVTLLTPNGAGQYGADGRWIDTGYTSAPLVGASIQRVSGKELQLLPQGLWTEEVFTIFSPVFLQPTQKDGPRGNRVQYDGLTFEIQMCSDRSDNALYFMATATKVDF
jgi:hypothetical protein